MKKILSAGVLIFIITTILIMQACHKEKEPPPDCKTCTARNNAGEIIKQQEVCTAIEEQTFRFSYPDTPVTCQ